MPRVEVKLPGGCPAIAIVEAERIALLLYNIRNVCAIRSFSKYIPLVLSVFHNAKGSPENPRILWDYEIVLSMSVLTRRIALTDFGIEGQKNRPCVPILPLFLVSLSSHPFVYKRNPIFAQQTSQYVF